jgi:hypothetical protein
MAAAAPLQGSHCSVCIVAKELLRSSLRHPASISGASCCSPTPFAGDQPPRPPSSNSAASAAPSSRPFSATSASLAGASMSYQSFCAALVHVASKVARSSPELLEACPFLSVSSDAAGQGWHAVCPAGRSQHACTGPAAGRCSPPHLAAAAYLQTWLCGVCTSHSMICWHATYSLSACVPHHCHRNKPGHLWSQSCPGRSRWLPLCPQPRRLPLAGRQRGPKRRRRLEAWEQRRRQPSRRQPGCPN